MIYETVDFYALEMAHRAAYDLWNCPLLTRWRWIIEPPTIYETVDFYALEMAHRTAYDL